MGKKTKIGKQRRDKFYQLAKETGYRSRAAFKLLQLNRKHEFLQKSRVLVDLCAAPGGWLQVASQNMPISSIIIGVDLVPIKPIHNVVTIQEDITSFKCKQLLKKELQTWKVDCILHDGAPNVGKNWLHDAFQQAQLTLSALKLGTEFLNKGGWFVTKMFRSKDYNSLLWVFRQFFKKVYATKPQASRTESAEIFVVCQHYLAPDKIDPKFLDPKHVFAEIDMQPEVKKLDLGNPDEAKRKKKAEGYPEGDYTLYHKVGVEQFIKDNNHLDLLSSFTEIEMDNEAIANHPLTTTEIKECCKDLKVLGRKDFRILLTWRKQIRKLLYTEEEAKSDDVIEEVEDEESKIQREIEEIEIAQAKEMKLKKKKVLKERRKLRDKMNLKMILPNDEPVVSEDLSLFCLTTIKNREQLKEVEEKDIAHLDEHLDDRDENDDVKLPKYLAYDRDDPLPDDYEDDGNSFEDSGESSDEKSLGSLDDEDDDTKAECAEQANDDEDKDSTFNQQEKNPLLLDLDPASVEEKDRRKIEMWFGKESFAGLEDDDDDDGQFKGNHVIRKLLANTNKRKAESKDELPTPILSAKRQKTSSKVQHEKLDNLSDETESSGDDSSDDSDYDVNTAMQNVSQIKTAKVSKAILHDAKKDGFEIVPQEKIGKRKKMTLDPEGLAIGSLMIQSKKMKRDILDLAWNRYTNNDENLPDWFVKDEQKHFRKQLPVTKEMVAQYKERLKEINARPVKKVAEAKARKKKRSMKKLEKARKKAEHIVESLDMTDREKAQQIKSIYKRAGIGAKPKTEVTYVVSKKGLAGKRVRRPDGVKGRFKVVDPRMKKDERKRKSVEKQVKNKRLPKSKLTKLKRKLNTNAKQGKKKTRK